MDYSAAIARGLTPRLLRDRAYIYKLQKRFQESKQDLEFVLKLEPDDRTSKDLAYIDELLTPKATRPPARR